MTEDDLIKKLLKHYDKVHPETIKAVRELFVKVTSMSQTDVVALTVNLGTSVGTQVIVLQPIVTALNTVLGAVSTFAGDVAVEVPALAGAAGTLASAVAAFAAAASTYTTTRTKAS